MYFDFWEIRYINLSILRTTNVYSIFNTSTRQFLMDIITLTSDLGTQTHYAAALQGILYTLSPHSCVVNISHQIRNFDVMEAAFVVKHAYPSFPKGTIHIIAVDPDYGEHATGVIMYCDEQYFIAPNNGVCSLIATNREKICFLIDEKMLSQHFPKSFRSAQVLAPAAAFLANGGKITEIAETAEIKELFWGEPIVKNHALRGKIIHIDTFGNAITNIDKQLFLEIKKEKSFEIFLRNIRLRRIVSTYSDVGKGDALAIFGSHGYLEIAMRESSAADLLGLKVHDMITLEFKDLVL